MTRERLLTVLVICGLVVLFVAAVYLPGQWIDRALRREIADERARADRAPLVLAQLKDARRQRDDHLSYLGKTQPSIPADPRLPDVLRHVHQAARRHGMTIVRLQPQAVESLKTYQRHPFQIDIRGDFREITAFLADLEESERLFQVDLVNLRQSELDTQPDSLEGQIRLSVFNEMADSTTFAEEGKSSGAT